MPIACPFSFFVAENVGTIASFAVVFMVADKISVDRHAVVTMGAQGRGTTRRRT